MLLFFSSRGRHTRCSRDWSSGVCFSFSSRRRHTRCSRDWSSDVCSSDLQLVETFAPGTTATNEPKRVKCGAPDFIVTNKQTPLGYIETKDIGISLDHTERTDQMKRYLSSLANLILTDYVEFRWYVTGEHRMTARLAKVGMKGKWIPETDGI